MIWKDVVGYEDFYEVSDTGLVRSKNSDRITKKGSIKKFKGREMKLVLRKNRRLSVYLCVKSKVKGFLVHRLVGAAFVPNPESKPFINHIDGNPANNAMSNLEWVTSSENNKHAFKLGLRSLTGERHSRAKLTDAQALEIKYSPVNNSILAKRFGVDWTTIHNIKSGYGRKHLNGLSSIEELKEGVRE